MATNAQTSSRRRFDAFEIDLFSGEVWKHGVRVRLQEQPYQILRVLLERAGEIVTREELKQTLWPGDTFVDFDDGLNTAVKKIRDLLGDSAERPRYIETIPRRGYRFLAPVGFSFPNKTAATSPPAKPSLVTPRVEAAPWQRKAIRRAVYAAAAVLALVAVLVAADVGGWRSSLSGRVTAPRIESVAVLPLANLSHDPDQEYFADGMTEELITTLTKISNLSVISWTSVRGYKNTAKTLPEIAKELNTDGVIDGSVERSGDRVKITIRLIQMPSGHNLWAESYDRELRDILSLQEEAAGTIARQVQVVLTPQDRVRLSGARPVDPEAYLLYTQGRASLQRWTKDSWQSARSSFHQAIEKDPNYAAAYAGLAETYLTGDSLDPKVSIPLARAAAAKALALDDTVSDAHVAVAQIKYMQDLDWTGSEKEFKRAIELNPGDMLAHHLYSHLLEAMGRNEESMRESELYVRLDPVSPAAYDHLGFQYLADGQYESAVLAYRKTSLLDPTWESSHWWLGESYRHVGMSEEALAEYERSMIVDKTSPQLVRTLHRAFKRGGWKAYWRETLSWQLKKASHEYVSPYIIADYYALLGDKSNAFLFLDKAYTDQDDNLTFLKNDHNLDLLHADPRYAALVRKIGLTI